MPNRPFCLRIYVVCFLPSEYRHLVHPSSIYLGGKGFKSKFLNKKGKLRNLTESELAGADESLTILIWINYCIKAQGYTVEKNIIYQDNKSTIILDKNGRLSSLKRTNHIKAIFFYQG